MTLTNIRTLGRYKNKITNQTYNVRVGKRLERSTDILFYTYKGSRIIISDKDFYSDNHEKIN